MGRPKGIFEWSDLCSIRHANSVRLAIETLVISTFRQYLVHHHRNLLPSLLKPQRRRCFLPTTGITNWLTCDVDRRQEGNLVHRSFLPPPATSRLQRHETCPPPYNLHLPFRATAPNSAESSVPAAIIQGAKTDFAVWVERLRVYWHTAYSTAPHYGYSWRNPTVGGRVVFQSLQSLQVSAQRWRPRFFVRLEFGDSIRRGLLPS